MENNKSQMKKPVAQANSNGDYVVLALTFGTLFLMTSAYFLFGMISGLEAMNSVDAWDVLVAFIQAIVGGGLVFLLFLLIGMFMVRMQRQIMLANSLQVEYSDYAWLRDWANQVAKEFRMPEIEVFITQDPYINAYAYGFAKPYNIVLHSATIRYLTKDELKTVVVHEMAHIKYGHTMALVYLLPFMSLPVIGSVAKYICGFWQRRTELTADRLALTYMRNPELVKAALIKVHVGPDAAKYMNDVARQWLRYKADRPMSRFIETFSSHPFLVRRLLHLDRYKTMLD